MGIQIETSDCQSGSTNGTSSPSVSWPTNLDADDLVVCVIGNDDWNGSTTYSWPTNWVELEDEGGQPGFAVAYFVAAGTESGTFSPTCSASQDHAWITLRITGHEDPDTTAPTSASSAGGTNTTPDPPNLNPSWDSGDTALWIAVCGDVGFNTPAANVTAYPSGYTHFTDAQQNTNSFPQNVIGVAAKVATGDSENPGTFTLSGSDHDWAAFTIAIVEGSTSTPVAMAGTATEAALSDDILLIVDRPIAATALSAALTGTVVLKRDRALTAEGLAAALSNQIILNRAFGIDGEGLAAALGAGVLGRETPFASATATAAALTEAALLGRARSLTAEGLAAALTGAVLLGRARTLTAEGLAAALSLANLSKQGLVQLASNSLAAALTEAARMPMERAFTAEGQAAALADGLAVARQRAILGEGLAAALADGHLALLFGIVGEGQAAALAEAVIKLQLRMAGEGTAAAVTEARLVRDMVLDATSLAAALAEPASLARLTGIYGDALAAALAAGDLIPDLQPLILLLELEARQVIELPLTVEIGDV